MADKTFTLCALYMGHKAYVSDNFYVEYLLKFPIWNEIVEPVSTISEIAKTCAFKTPSTPKLKLSDLRRPISSILSLFDPLGPQAQKYDQRNQFKFGEGQYVVDWSGSLFESRAISSVRARSSFYSLF